MEGLSDDDSFESFVKFKKSQNEEKVAKTRQDVRAEEANNVVRAEEATKEVVPAKQSDALEGKANFELLFALDAWLEPLKNFTARTRFVDLSREDVLSLLKSGSDLSGLERRLDEELKGHFPNGCFCKLHTRSPKDAVVKLEDPMLSLVKARMAKTPLLATAKQKRLIANADANLISTVARELFRVDSGKAILALCLKSSRVMSDLEKARGRGSVLVLREFNLCLPEFEFRCFVYRRTLTAVSQYCYSQYFPEMLERRPQIEAAITAFFAKTMPLYPMENFVCDLFLQFDGGNSSIPKVEIVELNPFFNDTGALLFSWKSEQDRKILGGRAGLTQPQFRYLMEPIDDPYECLPHEWREWFEKQRRFK